MPPRNQSEPDQRFENSYAAKGAKQAVISDGGDLLSATMNWEDEDSEQILRQTTHSHSIGTRDTRDRDL
jgi:hypothetical protein